MFCVLSLTAMAVKAGREHRTQNSEHWILNTPAWLPYLFGRQASRQAGITEYWTLNTEYWTLNNEHRITNTDYRIPITDYRSPITDHWLPITDHRPQNITPYICAIYQFAVDYKRMLNDSTRLLTESAFKESFTLHHQTNCSTQNFKPWKQQLTR